MLEKVPSDVVSPLAFRNKVVYSSAYISNIIHVLFLACPPRAQSEYYPAAPAAARLGDQFRAQLSQREHHRAGPQLTHQHRGESGDREAPHAGHQPRREQCSLFGALGGCGQCEAWSGIGL